MQLPSLLLLVAFLGLGSLDCIVVEASLRGGGGGGEKEEEDVTNVVAAGHHDRHDQHGRLEAKVLKNLEKEEEEEKHPDGRRLNGMCGGQNLAKQRAARNRPGCKDNGSDIAPDNAADVADEFSLDSFESADSFSISQDEPTMTWYQKYKTYQDKYRNDQETERLKAEGYDTWWKRHAYRNKNQFDSTDTMKAKGLDTWWKRHKARQSGTTVGDAWRDWLDGRQQKRATRDLYRYRRDIDPNQLARQRSVPNLRGRPNGQHPGQLRRANSLNAINNGRGYRRNRNGFGHHVRRGGNYLKKLVRGRNPRPREGYGNYNPRPRAYSNGGGGIPRLQRANGGGGGGGGGGYVPLQRTPSEQTIYDSRQNNYQNDRTGANGGGGK